MTDARPTICAACAEEFVPSRAGNRYCSSRCRIAAFRFRRVGVSQAAVRVSDPAAMLSAIDSLMEKARIIAARNRHRPKLVALLRQFVTAAGPVRQRWLAAATEETGAQE